MVIIVEAAVRRGVSDPLFRHRYSMAIRRATTTIPYGLMKIGSHSDWRSIWDDQTKMELERGEHMANLPPASA
ncbi:hypothetical protein PENTCL1PPCAC_2187 [Pristionchus entomophagus]|uniref:Uncharacterized protein n=1 Tax=Pristionchus entomophagus TaxID=358040 RepID=A0AAV5SBZ4_9BILA|nr:hypothetical protein PENTCL1PPCAC_2187 [Pristionchus entomophagus]